jgi:primase-polymerase (primpol)-like protein
VWRYTPDRKKLPINPLTGAPASITNPETWGTANDALKRLALGYENGIGFALNGTPFTVIDVDHTVGTNRTVYYPGKAAINLFNSYSEYSPTDGIHIWVAAASPATIQTKGMEIYAKERYITLTLNHVSGTPIGIENRQELIQRLSAAATPPMTQGVVAEAGQGKRYSDIQVIERALKNEKTGELFSRLFKGDPTLYTGAGALYPSKSEADYALIKQLAYWSYQDRKQIERIFRQSGLYSEKWDEKRGNETYGSFTIKKALRNQQLLQK